MNRTSKQIAVILGLVFLLIIGLGAYTVIDPIRADDQTEYRAEKSMERAAEIYAQNCRSCHGDQGEGGQASGRLAQAPALNLEANRPVDDTALRRLRNRYTDTITCGRVGTFMPAWSQLHGGSLTQLQIQQLVDFITGSWVITDPNGTILRVVLRGGEDLVQKAWAHAAERAEEIDHELEAAGAEAPPVAVTVVNAGSCLDNLLPGGASGETLLTPSAPATPDPDATPETDITLVAQNSTWDRTVLVVPAGEDFTITIDNQDAGVPHNIAIFPDEESLDEVIFRSELFPGVGEQVSEIPALDAGTYFFHCDAHPTTMRGSIEAR